VTVTLAVYVVNSPSLSMTRPRTTRLSFRVVGQFAVDETVAAWNPAPLPQSNAYWSPAATSALDGSNAPVSDSAIGKPALTSAGAVNVAVGATLATLTLPVYWVNIPSVSITLPRTANVPL